MTFLKNIDRRSFLALTTAGSVSLWSNPLQAMTETEITIPNIWSNGQLLAFSALDGATSYESGLVARSTDEPAGLILVHPARTEITFGKCVPGEVQLTNDTFILRTDKGSVKGAFVDAFHLLIEGPYTIKTLPPLLDRASDGSRTLIGARSHFDPSLLHLDMSQLLKQRQQWLREQAIPTSLPLKRKQTLYKALSVMKGQVNSPEGLIRHRWTTPDRWPHRDMWLWDSVFHALGWRHIDQSVAQDAISAVFDGQRPDGCIPHQLSPLKFSSVTQPPLLAFGVQQLAGKQPDGEWIAQFYPKLTKYLQWDFEHRVAPDDAAHWFIDPDPLSRSGESGMDNSPRFDGATRLYAVDFNAFLSMECAVMEEFAKLLGHSKEALEWRQKHEELNRTMNALMWNEDVGLYFDYDPVAKAQTRVKSVSGFMPLLCGAASKHQVKKLIAHINDPRSFGTPVPLPSAIASEGFANPHDMWRGPVWVNTNWLVALGLDRVGRRAEASKIREKTMREIERRYLELGSLFEFYDEESATHPNKLPRKGRLDPASPYHQAIHDYGWTTTLYADLVFSTSNRE
ncbi:amylo-alpha-1,6-glucosidase [Terriglobus tenax]|uniref:amylo-alpha-1,6-glucosidase n=1 Tax=Terriglobus tenax TaxID=1111115 RepID=UPI0021DF5749|nr:trehalase family glycosidase [Terriglobus tenax]